MAPEILRREVYDPGKADVWALGVLLYVMIVGAFPINAKNNDELFRLISKPKISIPKRVPRGLAELIMSMLQADPIKRPNCEEILRSQWLNEENDTENIP